MACLVDKVLQTIKENSMFDKNDKVIVAVSGGPDSICLLHLLNSIKEELQIKLVVAHVNHCLRGIEADMDENYVKEFCENINVKCYSIAVNINKISEEKNISSEMAGRFARYEYFNKIKSEIGANKIAIAHNANDQAETILMRIMRGTGTEGLIGMKPIRENIFVRPLINTMREQIEAYCERYNLNPRIDKTNLQKIYVRNIVRLELLPYIRKNFNKDIVNVLIRLGDNVKVDSDYLNNISEQKWKLFCERTSEKVIIKKEAFIEHEAILTRIIRKSLIALVGSTYNFERKHIIDIINLQKNNTGMLIELPNSIRAYNNYGNIIIYLKVNEISKDLNEYTLTIGEENKIPNTNLIVNIRVLEGGEKINLKKNDYVKYFDYDKIDGKMTLRYRRDGDRFISIGMTGTKKLKDIFINLKIDKLKRNRIPLICFSEDVAWIVGYRVSEKFKVENKTKKVLEIKVEREEKQ